MRKTSASVFTAIIVGCGASSVPEIGPQVDAGALTPAPSSPCLDGEKKVCGPEAVGACQPGTQTCVAGSWGACEGAKGPSPETCDGVDNDCNGKVDDASDAPTWYLDDDADGYGGESQVRACVRPDPRYVARGGDCRDNDAKYHPSAPESCADTVDYNCDGSTGYADLDGDGVAACLDCNDRDAAVRPGAAETCNGIDDNCDGRIDGADPAVIDRVYRDTDRDGFGDPLVSKAGCPSSGWVANRSDCNDTQLAIRPGAVEVCNNIDDNCDGAVDEGLASTRYRDVDGDGYGVSTTTVQSCFVPAGYAARAGDCDDQNGGRNPGAAEVDCDGLDNNCDTLVDGADPNVVRKLWYVDADADGYGSAAAPVQGCTQPAGYVSKAGDCLDSSADVHPGAPARSQHRGDGSFDFDCDGRETPTITQSGLCSGPTGVHNECTKREGWVGAVPACGQTGTLLSSCLLENRAGVGLGCYPYFMTPRQVCR